MRGSVSNFFADEVHDVSWDPYRRWRWQWKTRKAYVELKDSPRCLLEARGRQKSYSDNEERSETTSAGDSQHMRENRKSSCDSDDGSDYGSDCGGSSQDEFSPRDSNGGCSSQDEFSPRDSNPGFACQDARVGNDFEGNFTGWCYRTETLEQRIERYVLQRQRPWTKGQMRLIRRKRENARKVQAQVAFYGRHSDSDTSDGDSKQVIQIPYALYTAETPPLRLGVGSDPSS